MNLIAKKMLNAANGFSKEILKGVLTDLQTLTTSLDESAQNALANSEWLVFVTGPLKIDAEIKAGIINFLVENRPLTTKEELKKTVEDLYNEHDQVALQCDELFKKA